MVHGILIVVKVLLSRLFLSLSYVLFEIITLPRNGLPRNSQEYSVLSLKVRQGAFTAGEFLVCHRNKNGETTKNSGKNGESVKTLARIGNFFKNKLLTNFTNILG